MENREVMIQSAAEEVPVIYLSSDLGETFTRVEFSQCKFTPCEDGGMFPSGAGASKVDGKIITEWGRQGIWKTTLKISFDESFGEYTVEEKWALP